MKLDEFKGVGPRLIRIKLIDCQTLRVGKSGRQATGNQGQSYAHHVVRILREIKVDSLPRTPGHLIP